MLVDRSRLQPSISRQMVMETAREWIGPRPVRWAPRLPCAASLFAAELIALGGAILCGIVATNVIAGAPDLSTSAEALTWHGPLAILTASALAVIVYLG